MEVKFYIGDEDTSKAARYALALMGGSASKWVDRLEAKGQVPTSFPEFEQIFLEYFAPLDEAQNARDKLRKLSQTGDMQTYITAFEDCVVLLPDLPETEQIHAFIYGLKQETKKFVRAHSLAFGEPTLA